jgi:tRNA modification GTPase
MPHYQQLTPQGRGAIAVIAVSGSNTVDVIDACFTPVGKRRFKDLQKQLTYGHWNSTGEDLLIVHDGDANYEIQSHGSEAAVSAIKADLSLHGAQQSAVQTLAPLAPARFRADIQRLLCHASTARTAELLLQQWHILPPAIAQLKKDPSLLDSFLRWGDFGTRFHQRQSIVFCGRPNAGKSSLTNAILGFERAIVTEIAGTTRDVLTHHTVIDGWPVELSDTAGLRESENQIEQIGVAKAHQKLATADLIISVIDATAPQPWDQAEIAPDIIVINKSDLTDQRAEFQKTDVPVVFVSATKSTGFNDLLDAISKTLYPELPPADQPIPLTEAQIKDLR